MDDTPDLPSFLEFQAPAEWRTIDFISDLHLRADQVMVRSVQTPAIRDGQAVRFGARFESAWISGQFDRASGELSLVDERTLEIMGRPQQIRTSGHYRCQPVTAAPGTT